MNLPELSPWPQPWPPIPDFLYCADCASTVTPEGSADLTILAFVVTHSPTCPAWRGDERREVALAFLPPGHPAIPQQETS